MKILPKVDFETTCNEQARVDMPRMRNCQFPCKVMCMSVVTRQVKGKTNGKIYIKRVSEENLAKRYSYKQQISTNYITNHELENGEWKIILYEGHKNSSDLEAQEVLKLIKSPYELDKNLALYFS